MGYNLENKLEKKDKLGRSIKLIKYSHSFFADDVLNLKKGLKSVHTKMKSLLHCLAILVATISLVVGELEESSNHCPKGCTCLSKEHLRCSGLPSEWPADLFRFPHNAFIKVL